MTGFHIHSFTSNGLTTVSCKALAVLSSVECSLELTYAIDSDRISGPKSPFWTDGIPFTMPGADERSFTLYSSSPRAG